MSFMYRPYISVAEKTARARRVVQQMRKKGYTMQPIEPFSGAIAKTFWGKSWCTNLESYADYAYRLGRGRSYVRHGCVCDLEIGVGRINAIVNGSEMYKVGVSITTLGQEHWKSICERCSGQIHSLLELLQGKISKEVMAIVCEPQTGLFPTPGEISFTCSCPDWASMCKHVAAVLYGIGRRLDDDPSLLFTLRGVDASELLASNLSVPDSVADTLDGADVASLFGIDLEGNDGTGADTSCAAPVSPVSLDEPAAKPLLCKDNVTGATIQRLREDAHMSQSEFAEALSVTIATVRRWEGVSGQLRLRADSFERCIAFEKKYCHRQC